MLNQIFSSGDRNCFEITQQFLRRLGVRVSHTSLQSDLEYHPNYQTLLSISDILTRYDVDNVAYEVNPDQKEGVPVPFITQISSPGAKGRFFTIVESINSSQVRFYDPGKHRWVESDRKSFDIRWISDIVLIAEAGAGSGEKGYRKSIYEEKRSSLAWYMAWGALPALAILSGAWSFVRYGGLAFLPFLYTLLTLAGAVIGALLIWYELDQYNPLLQQICSAGKKVNCGAVLGSKASRIGGVSWSAIGFTYFAGGLFFQLFTGAVNPTTLSLLSWINLAALPYVFFSVYYQWRVAKQWCVLCLSVQGLLVAQFAVGLAGRWVDPAVLGSVFTEATIVPLLSAYLIPFILVSLLVPAYKGTKEGRTYKGELQRLKHSSEVFNSLLEKQDVLEEAPEGLGIVLGNAHASEKIIKVCNPYCGPCSESHKYIEELLKNNPEVGVQIVYAATNEDYDTRALPVRHFLAIEETRGQSALEEALDDWYGSPTKDYATFAARYPLNGELRKQDGKLDAMDAWCKRVGIRATPTFFFRGHKLPPTYNVADLKYFFSSTEKGGQS